MSKDILVTFVVDIHYEIDPLILKRYSNKLEKLYNKIDVLIDLNIIREINYKTINCKFICSKENIVNDQKLNYQRIYIIYEIDNNNASYFVHKVKERILFIFDEYIDNKIMKINSFELVNEKIDYDYYENYWNSFTMISDSPRLYSPRKIKK